MSTGVCPANEAATPAVTARWTAPRALLAALAVSLAVSFVGVFDHSLWTPDEPRDAEVGREMLQSGDYLVPTLAGEPFLEKPPLAWWAMAGFYHVFGVSDGVARSASALAGVLTLLLVFDLMRRVADPFAALMATVAAATMSGFFIHFHRAIVDPWLALFVMLGYWAFVLAAFPAPPPEGFKPSGGYSASSSSRPCPLAIGILYLAAGLAFLVKGPVGVALLVGPVAVGIAVGRRWSFFRSWAHVPGLLLFAALCLAWPLMLYRRGGMDLLNQFLLDNLVYRFAPPAEGGYAGGHRNPFWYYLVQFPLETLPWLFAFPAIIVWLRRRSWPAGWNSPALLFLASVFPVGLVLLSVPATKRGLYLLPLLAPLGATVGAWLAATARREHSRALDGGTQKLLVNLFFGVLAAAAVVASKVYLDSLGLTGKHTPDLGAFSHSPATPALFLLSIGVAVVIGVRARRLGWGDAERLVPLVVCAALALIVLGASLAFRTVDGFKNLHRMTADLTKLDAVFPSLVGYQLDETTRAIIPFDARDTGKALRDLTTPDELARHILANPSGKLLTFERHLDDRDFPKDLRSRLRRVRSWGSGSHRAYGLYEFTGTPAKD